MTWITAGLIIWAALLLWFHWATPLDPEDGIPPDGPGWTLIEEPVEDAS